MVRAYTALLLVALVLSTEAQMLKPESMSNRASMGECKAIAINMFSWACGAAYHSPNSSNNPV
jgi:hypothetical protein